MLAWLFVSGRMSLAAAGTAVFGFYQLGGQLRGLYMSATSLYEATLFIHDYSSFLQLEPSAERTAPTAGAARLQRLTAENVSFTYPETDRPAVDGISIEIGAGEVIALVGENGSGKTTLAKMLAGLYRPESVGSAGTTSTSTWTPTSSATRSPSSSRTSSATCFRRARTSASAGTSGSTTSTRSGPRRYGPMPIVSSRTFRGVRDDARP